MKKFAQILEGRVHWIFERESKPNWASNIILVDITGKEDIEEGWDYNQETRVFMTHIDILIEEPTPQPTNQEIQKMQMTILSGIADVYMATLGF
ncbi:hypothetical protein [Clostridium sp.]|jgi:hypothetical protein|uniref:hypothetical protein n=1 Tax=Clostridium sp. TaxID=1506 RepID=UPI003EECA0CD